MVKQIIIRMNYNTLKRIKKEFPSFPNETMPSYFGRLAVFMEETNQCKEVVRAND